MFKLIKIQLEIFASLQTLFPPLKIDIFCRIVPLSFIKKVIKIQLENFATLENFWTPANAVSSFENWHFLLHRPPYFSLNDSTFLRPCKSCFPLWKLSFSVASSPYYLPMFSTNYAQTACSPLTMRRPYDFPIPEKICTHANAVSPFENRHFLTHRPPMISPSRNSLCRENRIRGARAARTAGYAE